MECGRLIFMLLKQINSCYSSTRDGKVIIVKDDN